MKITSFMVYIFKRIKGIIEYWFKNINLLIGEYIQLTSGLIHALMV